jgi:hypothetical protein
MPNTDLRARLVAHLEFLTAGKRAVTYIDAKGRSRAATVTGQGTSSGVKLRVAHPKTDLDNVAVCSTEGSVSCYRAR